MELQRHPDSKVILRDADGAAVYLDSLENFTADNGAALPAPDGLPAGCVDWVYKDSLLRATVGGAAEAVPGAWAAGDDILARADAIAAAKATREAGPTLTLEELAEQVRGDINRWRDEAISAPLAHGGHTWDMGETSRRNIADAVTAINAGIDLPADFKWRDADNADRQMTSAGMIALGGAVLARVNTAYTTSWTLKDSIQPILDGDKTEAKKRAALNAIAWPEE